MAEGDFDSLRSGYRGDEGGFFGEFEKDSWVGCGEGGEEGGELVGGGEGVGWEGGGFGRHGHLVELELERGWWV